MRDADETPPIAGVFCPRPARGCEGFFRALQEDTGRWWLVDPAGDRVFVRAVHGVFAEPVHVDGALPADPATRLRGWGFNAVGVSADCKLREDGLPIVLSAEFCATAQVILGPGVRLPDVFDLEWAERADAHAREICAARADARGLVGWLTDADLAWASPTSAGRPSLLQLCLSLEPSFAAYHAAWEFVLALHGGRLEAVAQAWNASLPNKEMVRELTRAEEGLGTRGYLRDDARWAREFARRYFNTTAAAIRATDPNHLVLGCRFQGVVSSAILAECVYPAVDVSLPRWSELPAVSSNPAQPMLADGVNWAAEEFLRSVAGRRTGRLTTVERMLRKARTALDRMARHPAVVGYAWARWRDNPGEEPPFAGGLLHVNGREAREHTELLTQFNQRAENLHGAAIEG